VIDIKALSSRVGSFALREITFSVPDGAYGVVIGPAGSGKTTLLETIGGIVPATGGVVRLHGRDVTRLPPEARDIGLVYQQGYLFPHLTVAQNVEYGAASPSEGRELATRFGIDGLWAREAGSLSGGERQLVALARALAGLPRVLLLDEPFAALDPRKRAYARREVRAVAREQGMTVLQVTHDFAEAGMLGDVAVLLDAGRVLQAGPPEDVFRKPASPYIAEFLGAENVFAGTVVRAADSRHEDAAEAESQPSGYYSLEFRVSESALTLAAVGDAPPGPGCAVLRAEDVVLSREPSGTSARNCFRGRVVDMMKLGALTRVTVAFGGVPLVAALTTRSVRELGLVVGEEVYASFKATAVHVC
jgi:molybdopterin-binding protein